MPKQAQRGGVAMLAEAREHHAHFGDEATGPGPAVPALQGVVVSTARPPRLRKSHSRVCRIQSGADLAT